MNTEWVGEEGPELANPRKSAQEIPILIEALADAIVRGSKNASPSMNTVPNKPKTPIRGVRVPDEEWHPAQAKAKAESETVTDVVRRALREYVKEDDDA